MSSFRARWTGAGLPPAGTRLTLEEVDDAGVPTGLFLAVVVAAQPSRHASSTQRLVAIAALSEPPHLCVCLHVRVLHDHQRGPCTLCGEEACPLYRPKDPREEPL